MQELNAILSALDTQVKNINTSQYEIFYRGLENIDYKDVPTIFRQNKLNEESTIFNELIRNYPEELGNAYAIDIISFMQHYGNCSRMLDVTMNALTALFFACGGWNKGIRNETFNANLSTSGSVRIYKIPKDEVKYVDSEQVVLLANIARLDDTKNRTFGHFEWECERDQKGVWHKYADREELLQKNVRDVNKVVLVKSNLSNPRVRAQFGAFFLFGGLNGVQRLDYASQQHILSTPVNKQVVELPQKYVHGDICIPKEQKEHILDILNKYFCLNFSTICPEKHDMINALMAK